MKLPKRSGGYEIRGDLHDLISLALVLAIGAFFGWVTNKTILPDYQWESYMFGAVVWTVILFFTPAIDMFVIYPRQNYSLALEDPFRRKPVLDTDKKLTGPQPTKTMRVIIGPRVAGKLPWQGIVQGKVIHMVRAINIGGNLECQTEEGIKVFVKWLIYLTAIAREDCVMNLIRNDEQAVKGEFEAKAKGFILRFVKTLSYDDLFFVAGDDHDDNEQTMPLPSGQVKLREKFRNLFGGPDILSDIEVHNGVYSGEPLIEGITPHPDYMAAVQAKAIAEKHREAIDAYTVGTPEKPGMHRDVAANLAASDRGKPMPANYYNLEGMKKGARFWIGAGNQRG